MTTSEKLLRLKQTQPNIDSIIQTCISFRNMVAGKKDAPDIDTWLKLAYDCNCPKLASFCGIYKSRQGSYQEYISYKLQ